MTTPEAQTSPAPWGSFKTEPERNCLFLLPFLFEPKTNLNLKDGPVIELCSRIQALHEFLSQSFNVEVAWIESGNHFTREFLDTLPFEAKALSRKNTSALFIDSNMDLLVANGLEILDLIHNPAVPTLLHLGFLPEPKAASSAKVQKIRFTAPGKADFVLGHNPFEMDFIRSNQPLFGITELNESLVLIDEKTSSPDFESHEMLRGFLNNPVLSPKTQGVIAMLDAEYQRSLQTTRDDLVEQRESQLKWMRKAFTQEISTLLQSNEGLHREIDTLKQNQPRNQDDKVKHLKAQCAELKNLIQELQARPEPDLEPATCSDPTPSLRIHEMETYIKDLEEQINRYRNQVHFMFMRWVSSFVQTWLIRLPLTLALLTYFIGASYGHRIWLAKRG